MKVLIWVVTYIGGFIVLILLDLLFYIATNGNFKAGFLFDLGIMAACAYVARRLCKKWDIHKKINKQIIKRNKKTTGDKKKTNEEFLTRIEEYGRRRDIVYDNQRPFDDDFGFSKTNPIGTSSIGYSEKYLSQLRTLDGKELFWLRKGSICVESIGEINNVMVDVYRLYLNGIDYSELYICPYSHSSKYVPKGFVLADTDDREFCGSISRESIKKNIPIDQLILLLQKESDEINIDSNIKEAINEENLNADSKTPLEPELNVEETKDLNNNIVAFCRKCGIKLYKDSDFCHKCGTKIIKVVK